MFSKENLYKVFPFFLSYFNNVENQEEVSKSQISLPKEILAHIFSFLKPQERMKISSVCKFWKEIVRDNLVWKQDCINENIKLHKRDSYLSLYKDNYLLKHRFYVLCETKSDPYKRKFQLSDGLCLYSNIEQCKKAFFDNTAFIDLQDKS